MNMPATIPQVEIECNGARVSADLLSRLVSVRVQQRLSLPTACDLVFIDPAHLLGPDDGLTAIDSSLRVTIRDAECDLFAGEITGIEWSYHAGRGREIKVRAYDVLNRLGRRQKVRAFVQSSLEDIARELTSDLGIDVGVIARDHIWDRVIQHDQTIAQPHH